MNSGIILVAQSFGHRVLTAAKGFHGHGYLMSRSEITALVQHSGYSSLLFLDGGLGLLSVGEDEDRGCRNLLQRGLFDVGLSHNDVKVGSFFEVFLSILKSRQSMLEMRVGDPTLPNQISHWIATSQDSASIVQTVLDDDRLKFWFAIVASGQAKDMAMSLAEVGAIETMPTPYASGMSLTIEEFTRFVTKLRQGSRIECDRHLRRSSINDETFQCYSEIFRRPFRSVETILEKRDQFGLVIGQFNWLETDDHELCVYEKSISDDRLELTTTSPRDLQTSLDRILDDFL